jgi:glucosamine-6-phosphate deaminase
MLLSVDYYFLKTAILTMRRKQMRITVSQNEAALGVAAATEIISLLSAAIKKHGEASCVLSTGASQFSTFEALLCTKMDWSKVTVFHLDEYLGLSANHPASFRKYLKDRFIEKITPKRVVFVDGQGDVEANIRELEREITAHPADVGVIGLGENAHIAFNDPPANFQARAHIMLSR